MSNIHKKRVENGKDVGAQIHSEPDNGHRASARAHDQHTRLLETALASVHVPKREYSPSAIKLVLRIFDTCAIVAMIVCVVWTAYIGQNNNSILAPLSVALLGAIIFIGLLFASGAYKFAANETYQSHMKKVIYTSFAGVGMWLSIVMLFRPVSFQADALAVAGLGVVSILCVFHTIYYRYFRGLHKLRALAPNIIMLGATESARRLIEQNLRTPELNILAIFDDRLARAPSNIHGVPVVDTVDAVKDWDKLPFIDRIVVTLPSIAIERKTALVEKVRLLPNRVSFVVDEFESSDDVRDRLTQIADIGFTDVSSLPRTQRYVLLKRAFDCVASAVGIVLLLPVFAVVAALIKLESPGPVLFKQKRHGFNNREFYVLKFRSMRNDCADAKAEKQVVKGDPRVTKVGNIIRKTSLDEIPQLFNVLAGDMSLVGPRPHAIGMRTGDTESYTIVDEYAHRHKVKPGVTGWAQINGSRGPLHDFESVKRRVRLDLEYIERASFWFDVMIILKTLPCLLGDKVAER